MNLKDYFKKRLEKSKPQEKTYTLTESELNELVERKIVQELDKIPDSYFAGINQELPAEKTQEMNEPKKLSEKETKLQVEEILNNVK